jgi:CRP-like cAMP-binding protein
MPMLAHRDKAASAASPGRSLGLAALDQIGTVVTLARDDTLFFQGDPAEFYFKVVSGAVRSCTLLADGRRHVGDFFLAGAFCGLGAEASYAFTAEAVTEVTLVRYARRSVDRLMAQQPQLGRSLIDLLCHDLQAAQQQRILLSRMTAVERVAAFLLHMAERNGDARITLPMTRTDIGDHLGLTTETVSRVLSQLCSAGVIALDGVHDVRLQDRNALQDLTEAM